MNQAPIRRFLGLLLMPLGIALSLGGAGELLAGLAPEWLGEGAAAIEILHRDPIVRGWVVLQGLISMPLGVAFVVAGRGLATRAPRAADRVRWAARILLGLVLMSQLLLTLLVYPVLLRLPAGSIEPSAGFWVMSLAGAAVGPIAVSVGALFILRRSVADRDRRA